MKFNQKGVLVVVDVFLLASQTARVQLELPLMNSVRCLHYCTEGESHGRRSPPLHILSRIITSSQGGLRYGSHHVSKKLTGNIWQAVNTRLEMADFVL